MSIEESLVAATKIAAVSGESRSQFLKRLAKAAGDLPDADFKVMPETAQAWQADAANKINKKKKVPDFSDADPDDIAKRFPAAPSTVKTKESPVSTTTAEKPSKKVKAAKPEKVVKAKKSAKDVPPAKVAKPKRDAKGGPRDGAGRKPRADSATTLLASYLLNHACKSRTDLRAYADREGISMADSSLGALWHYGSAVARVARKRLEKAKDA